MAKISLPEFKFLHYEAAGGIVLVFAAVMAMVAANSPAASVYNTLLETHVTAGSAPLVLTKRSCTGSTMV